jgi:DNA-binding transcriptional LysR family regulator
MHPLRRLVPFWNWLPAFRAVAESQHLPTASRELNVTAPALSRSVKLLEAHLGQKLFRREGRRIKLTDQGEDFLAAVRDGMRLVHKGLADLQDTTPRGSLFILSSGFATHYVIDGLKEIHRRHPGLHLHVGLDPVEDAPHRLLRGELDLAFHSHSLDVTRLKTERLGEAGNGLYCGPGHPLYGKRKVTPEQIIEHEFVAPTVSGGYEGWPPDLPRSIGMRVSHMHLGCEVCAQGHMLAALPDVFARRFGDGQVLKRLPFELLPPTPLFATYREHLSARTHVEAVLEAVRTQVVKASRRERRK